MLMYKIDQDGMFIEDVIINNGDVTSHDLIETQPPQGLYKPKWKGDEWVEGKTEEEFLEDGLLNSLKPTAQELSDADFEIKTLSLLIEMGVI